MIKTSRQKYYFFLLVLLAFALRIPLITADAPGGDLTRSSDFLGDEGIWGVSALRWALSGDWQVADAYNPGAAVPLFMLLEYGLFRVFGIDLAMLRYASVVASVLFILGFYVLLKRINPPSALLAAALLALSFPLVIYNRLAFLENTVLMFWGLSLLLFYHYLEHKPGTVTLCCFWLALAAACLSKPTALFLLPVLVATLVLYRRAHWHHFLFWSALCAIVIMALYLRCWIVPHYPDWAFFHQLNVGSRVDWNLHAILKNWFTYLAHLHFFAFMPLTFTLAFWQILASLGAWRRRETVPLRVGFFVLWAVAGFLFFGLFSYSPTRYAVLWLPAVIALAADWLATDDREGWRGRLSWPGYLLLVLLIASQCSYAIYRYLHYGKLLPSLVLPWLALPGLWLLWRVESGQRRRGLKWLWLAFIVATQLVQIVRYYAFPHFTLHAALSDAAACIRMDPHKYKVLAGDSAGLIAFQARTPVVDVVFRPETLPQLVERMPPLYLFLEDPAILARLQKQMPAFFSAAREIRRYRIMDNYAHAADAVLYRLEPPGGHQILESTP